MTGQEARERLAVHGPIRLPERCRKYAVMRFLAHFTNVLIYLLHGAPAGHGRRRRDDPGADLWVMGAYAHSRMQQAVRGGVTSELLRDSPIKLLLAH